MCAPLPSILADLHAPRGWLASRIDFEYDPAHRLVGMADGQGNRIRYTLDPMGNRD